MFDSIESDCCNDHFSPLGRFDQHRWLGRSVAHALVTLKAQHHPQTHHGNQGGNQKDGIHGIRTDPQKETQQLLVFVLDCSRVDGGCRMQKRSGFQGYGQSAPIGGWNEKLGQHDTSQKVAATERTKHEIGTTTNADEAQRKAYHIKLAMNGA